MLRVPTAGSSEVRFDCGQAHVIVPPRVTVGEAAWTLAATSAAVTAAVATAMPARTLRRFIVVALLLVRCMIELIRCRDYDAPFRPCQHQQRSGRQPREGPRRSSSMA